MLFRFEDTDPARSKKEYEQNIIESLEWLGIKWDSPVITRQTERTGIYKTHLKKIIESGHAYLSKETPTKVGERDEVIRFKNPNKKIIFTDLIRGEVSFDTTDLGDFIIARSVEEPLYHLAVVVDDFEMGITHVIRGEDGISNTPRQILIQEAIGAPRPVYAHIPLILAPDKSKLSGRYGAVGVTEYKNMGYLPEAIINYLALLGWNPGTEQEIFSLEELVKKFDLSKVQKGGAIFDTAKLDWINKEWMKKITNYELRITNEIKKILNLKENEKTEEVLEKVVPLVLERINKLGDIKAMADGGELTYFFSAPKYEPNLLVWKKGGDVPSTKKHLASVASALEKVNEKNWTKESVKEALWSYAEKEGRGNVLWPLRVALSGQEKSPDPFTLAEVLGKEEVLARIQTATSILG